MDKDKIIKKLVNLYREVNCLMHASKFDEISEMFRNFDDELIFGLGMLRVTFVVKERIPFWNQLRDKVKKQVEETGKDPKIVMRGLL